MSDRDWARSVQNKIERATSVITSARVIAEAINERDDLKEQLATVQEKAKPMATTPELAGVTSAFDKFLTGLKQRSQKLAARIETADAKADSVFAKGAAKIEAKEAEMAEIDSYLDQIDRMGDNGGPLSGSETP